MVRFEPPLPSTIIRIVANQSIQLCLRGIDKIPVTLFGTHFKSFEVLDQSDNCLKQKEGASPCFLHLVKSNRSC